MKNYKNFIIITVIILITFFTVRSRRIHQSTFNFLVLDEQTEILKSCIALSEYEMGRRKDKPEVYFLGFHIKELCKDHEKMKKIIEEKRRKYYRENWLFVY